MENDHAVPKSAGMQSKPQQLTILSFWATLDDASKNIEEDINETDSLLLKSSMQRSVLNDAIKG